MVWKFCEKGQFPTVSGESCGNCAFPQNFHTRKLAGIKIFFAVEGDRRWTDPEKLHFIFKNIKYFRNLNITSEITIGRYHNRQKIVNFNKNYNKNMFFLRQLLQSLTEKKNMLKIPIFSHFSIRRFDILIFCNILHLEMNFWNLY